VAKVYQFSQGAAPVRAGDPPRPRLSAASDAGGGAVVTRLAGDGDGSAPGEGTTGNADPGLQPAHPAAARALQLVGDLSIDRLLGADEDVREARVARLRWAGTRVGAAALALVLFYAVFPVRTYLDQRAAGRRAREKIEVLGRENDRLEERTESLEEDPEIERIAREQYGMVLPGEESYGLLPGREPAPDTPSTTDP
jgi:cell division protein FtsB